MCIKIRLVKPVSQFPTVSSIRTLKNGMELLNGQYQKCQKYYFLKLHFNFRLREVQGRPVQRQQRCTVEWLTAPTSTIRSV